MGVFLISVDLINNTKTSNYDNLFDLITQLANHDKARLVTRNVIVFESLREAAEIRQAVDALLKGLKISNEISRYHFIISKIDELEFKSKEAYFLKKIKQDNHL
ncbi:hypothetical protein CHL76_09195 [Marinococcus halophilus]|uniref:Uncharacterized protein n=1 Tax=Marinococcus halophilus TaxID=1371 RepID=A0A510Y4S9_MARHA|nr:hypothetical protein [Marinococcus halophilus]OZT80271.1 hypothetical protein CHL76_09195 [Marinococcus halophilus]GEK58334.1 hypothetical protein MHA01_12390 [Marinococcus halophilus]